MTKPQALLTVQDVKDFVFEAIQGITAKNVVNRKDMKLYFGITEYQLDCFIAKGLPWAGPIGRKKFNIKHCKSWFYKNGYKDLACI